MDAGGAAGEQLGALEGGVGDAEIGDRLLVAAARLQLGLERGRKLGGGELGHPLDAVEREDRHHAGDDRDGDPDRARPLDEVEVEAVVEEHLRDQEGRAGVDLRLQVPQVVVGRGRVDVRLGEGRAADGEVVVVAQQRHQLVAELEAAVGLRPALLAVRRVAAEGEDVLDAAVAHAVEHTAQLVGRGVDAGQVRHRLQAQLLLDLQHDPERPLARRAAGAVGDRDVVGRHRLQVPERLRQVDLPLSAFR